MIAPENNQYEKKEYSELQSENIMGELTVLTSDKIFIRTIISN